MAGRWILVGAVLAGTTAVVAVLWRVGESEGARAADRFARRGALLGVAAACLGMWALIELTVRAVPAASDAQSLAFDDALRADAVRRLLGTTGNLPLAAGLFVAQAGPWPAARTALVGLYVPAPWRWRACRSWGRPGPTTAGGCGRPPVSRGRPCS